MWTATGPESQGAPMHSGWAFDSSTLLHFASEADTAMAAPVCKTESPEWWCEFKSHRLHQC